MAVVTEEMWNVQIRSALCTGLVDVAVALCPELSADLTCEVVRRERIVAFVPVGIRLPARSESLFAISPQIRSCCLLVAPDHGCTTR